MKPLKVLVVVEDDHDMRTLIDITLSLDGRLEVFGACATAQEAIDLAAKTQPDLIILDHFIDGDVMGLQAAPDLKRAAPNAKILLFTSHDLALEARREPAIDAFLRKNDLPQLLPTVLSLLGLEPDRPAATG